MNICCCFAETVRPKERRESKNLCIFYSMTFLACMLYYFVLRNFKDNPRKTIVTFNNGFTWIIFN